MPSLPSPCAYTSAACIDNVIYVAGGTSRLGLETAMTNFWALDLSKLPDCSWKKLLPWPGPSRAFNITVAQHNGKANCIYVISGRHKEADDGEKSETRFLSDVYEFNPDNYDPEMYNPETGEYTGLSRTKTPWRRRADTPQCVMAGTGIGIGQSHIFVLGGADGSLFFKADQLKDNHPGFPKEAFAYHTITHT